MTPEPRSRPGERRERQRNYERRLILMTLAAGAPGVVVSLALLAAGDYSAKVWWTLVALIGGCWLGFSFALRARVVRPLQTLSNLLAALREGDYSIRARGAASRDALAEVIREVNALGETLREQRLGALEATALLRTVMAEIDVAVFAFDPENRLRLINRAGERLLAASSERLLARTAAELGLADYLGQSFDGTPLTSERSFPGAAAGGPRTWGVRRSVFRERGQTHHLLVIADLSQPLREEERRAWQRLVRVIGHELNNSLAPIKSIAGSLTTLLSREPRPADWRDDMRRGLSVVSSRAESLGRFMDAYARLAKLPPPKRAPLHVGALVRRVVALETRLAVEVAGGPEVVLNADADQLEQLLINLIRNAVDASLVTGGGVQISWQEAGAHLDLRVADEGLGLASTANLFVPFFTTKPQGTGVGLVLSRQIAEAHGGTLALDNRRDRAGCEALLRLPL